MRAIPTTRGQLPSDGGIRVLGHEHVRTVPEAVFHQFPAVFDREAMLKTATRAFAAVVRHGVTAVCDPTVLGLGRDVRFNIEVTERAGVDFIMATGVYCTATSLLPSYLAVRTAGDLAELFVRDIEDGIQQTSVRAAFIKLACEAPVMTQQVELCHRAAARASSNTGAPVMVHTSAESRCGTVVLDVLEDEGLDLGRVQIAHAGDSADLGYLRSLLQRGAYLGMDRFGLDHLLDRDTRCRTIAQLCQDGWSERLVLGQDYCSLPGWATPERIAERWPDWSHHLIFDSVIPRLIDLGVQEAFVEGMVGANVIGWLSSGRV